MELNRKPTVSITTENRQLNLEVNEDLIAFWVVNDNKENPETPAVLVYIYSRKNMSMWHGEAQNDAQSIEGEFIMPQDEDYLLSISCLRTYLGDLFMLRPYDLRILEAIADINCQTQSPYEELLRLLAKKK